GFHHYHLVKQPLRAAVTPSFSPLSLPRQGRSARPVPQQNFLSVPVQRRENAALHLGCMGLIVGKMKSEYSATPLEELFSPPLKGEGKGGVVSPVQALCSQIQRPPPDLPLSGGGIRSSSKVQNDE